MFGLELWTLSAVVVVVLMDEEGVEAGGGDLEGGA